MTDQQIALVTGANRGIGKEVARDHELKVLIGSRDVQKGRLAAQEIGHGAEALDLDVSDHASVHSAFRTIEAT